MEKKLTWYLLSQNIALEKQMPPTTLAFVDRATSEFISDTRPRKATVRMPRRRVRSPRALTKNRTGQRNERVIHDK